MKTSTIRKAMTKYLLDSNLFKVGNIDSVQHDLDHHDSIGYGDGRLSGICIQLVTRSGYRACEISVQVKIFTEDEVHFSASTVGVSYGSTDFFEVSAAMIAAAHCLDYLHALYEYECAVAKSESK